MYGKTEIMKPGDMVETPKDVVHSAEVLGEKSVFFFEAMKDE